MGGTHRASQYSLASSGAAQLLNTMHAQLSLFKGSSLLIAIMMPQVPVFCNGLHGVYLLGRQRIVCSCPDCLAKPEAKREHSCTQFEMHCGAGAAKKWKASLRVEPGGVPEVPAGACDPLRNPSSTCRASLMSGS